MDRAGNLYGTTVCEGANNVGTVFKLTPSGNSWTYTDLHDFYRGTDGAYPISSVTLDASSLRNRVRWRLRWLWCRLRDHTLTSHTGKQLDCLPLISDIGERGLVPLGLVAGVHSPLSVDFIPGSAGTFGRYRHESRSLASPFASLGYFPGVLHFKSWQFFCRRRGMNYGCVECSDRRLTCNFDFVPDVLAEPGRITRKICDRPVLACDRVMTARAL